MTKRHAVALRAFNHADETFADKQVILAMDASQFRDWSAEDVGLVREATPAEVARAKGEPAPSAAVPKRARKAKATPKTPPAPAAPAADPIPPAGQEDPR